MAAALAAAAWCPAAPALADVDFAADASPEVVRYPATRTITYTLAMTAGPADERFAVTLEPPVLEDGSSPVGGNPTVVLAGPGRFGPRGGVTHSTPACGTSRVSVPARYEPVAVTREVLLPANSTSSLLVSYDTGRTAPWPSFDYRARFVAKPRMLDGSLGTLPNEVVVPTPSLQLEGPFAAEIELRTTPASSPAPARSQERIRAGTTIAITGRVRPGVRGGRVVLQYVGPGAPRRPRTIAVVRTRRGGRFSHRDWQPSAPGRYELFARYPRQPGGVLPGTTCPRAFTLVR